MKTKQAAAKPAGKKSVSNRAVKKTQAGLSMQEWIRLKFLQHQLKSESQKKPKPDTAQKSIPFRRMYPDGICHVDGHYYTKMVEFFDINYSLLEAEDQRDIRSLYREFLDYFEPGVRVQIFFFNRKVSAEVLEEQFSVKNMDDEFREMRSEQINLLHEQAAKGNNGIVKSKYVIFGMKCEDVNDARHKLGTMEKDIIRNMNNIGTVVRGLNGRERLQILYEYFHQDTMDPFHFSWKEMQESGSSVMDYIAPTSFDFRYKNRFQVGDMYGTSHL